tara:strand:- start:26722 stop:28776 length:2055 start_codon:yes stop_codon:yes gene_type:complete
MFSKQHHIRRQLLDFEFNDKVSALQWQQKVPSQYLREYERAIENTLDHYDDGRCQKIDKIILDLGTLRADEIADQLGTALDNILNKMLLKNVQHYEITNVDPRTKTTIDVKAISSKDELFCVFQYFITHGNFPWNTANTKLSDLELQLKDQYTIAELTSLLKSKKVFQNQLGRARFFYQFESKFVNEVYSVYFEKEYKNLKIIIDFCKKQFSKPGFVQHFKKEAKSLFSGHILEWISLFTPENGDYWSIAFIPWYIEKQWVSVIPFSSIAIWVSADNDDLREPTPLFLKSHLKKVFKHLDLHLTAITKENALSKAKASDEENQPLLTHKVPSRTQTSSDIENGVPEAKGGLNKNLEENRNGKPNITDNDPLPNPFHKDVDISNLQNGVLEGTGPDNEDSENLSVSSFEKDEQGSEKGMQVERKYHSESSENDSEVFLKNEEKEKSTVAKETGKEDESNPDDTMVPKSNKSHITPDDNVKDDLMVPNEFYREVEETLDALGVEGKEQWNTGNDINSTATDPYYIHDSGIVLVWPYLNRLFEKLNYVRNKDFLSKDLQERAIMVLGFIATGDPFCEEHQLVFAKFLCGWPFRMPVKKSIKLTKHELKEVNIMLTGLIRHWSVLKNTSISGLRETFFYREGKLEPQEDDWKLTVEQKGTDILLDRLPYGLSIIKLPWLKKMLRVYWV